MGKQGRNCSSLFNRKRIKALVDKINAFYKSSITKKEGDMVEIEAEIVRGFKHTVIAEIYEMDDEELIEDETSVSDHMFGRGCYLVVSRSGESGTLMSCEIGWLNVKKGVERIVYAILEDSLEVSGRREVCVVDSVSDA